MAGRRQYSNLSTARQGDATEEQSPMTYDYKKIRQARRLDASPKVVRTALQRACRKRRLSVVGLARLAGLPLLSTQMVVSGRSKQPSFWTIARLAQALKLDLNYLAGLAPAQKGKPYGQQTLFD